MSEQNTPFFSPLTPPPSTTYSGVFRGIFRRAPDYSHRCVGKWSPTRERYGSGKTWNFQFHLSPSEVARASPSGLVRGQEPFPLNSTRYAGSFKSEGGEQMIDHDIALTFRHRDDSVAAGMFDVSGGGRNGRFGAFSVSGTLSLTGPECGQLELYRTYLEPAMGTCEIKNVGGLRMDADTDEKGRGSDEIENVEKVDRARASTGDYGQGDAGNPITGKQVSTTPQHFPFVLGASKVDAFKEATKEATCASKTPPVAFSFGANRVPSEALPLLPVAAQHSRFTFGTLSSPSEVKPHLPPKADITTPATSGETTRSSSSGTPGFAFGTSPAGAPSLSVSPTIHFSFGSGSQTPQSAPLPAFGFGSESSASKSDDNAKREAPRPSVPAISTRRSRAGGSRHGRRGTKSGRGKASPHAGGGGDGTSTLETATKPPIYVLVESGTYDDLLQRSKTHPLDLQLPWNGYEHPQQYACQLHGRWSAKAVALVPMQNWKTYRAGDLTFPLHRFRSELKLYPAASRVVHLLCLSIGETLLEAIIRSNLYAEGRPERRDKDAMAKIELVVKAEVHNAVDGPIPGGKVWRFVHDSMRLMTHEKYSLPNHGDSIQGVAWRRAIVQDLPEQVQTPNEDGEFPLHIALANPYIVTHMKAGGSIDSRIGAHLLIRDLVQLHPDALRNPNKEGLLPLHIGIRAGLLFDFWYYGNDDEERVGVEDLKRKTGGWNLLLRPYPAAASVRFPNGQLPLHVAVVTVPVWEENLENIARAHLDALVTPDPVTKLFPFMLAAADGMGGGNLDIVFKLLRVRPDMEKFMCAACHSKGKSAFEFSARMDEGEETTNPLNLGEEEEENTDLCKLARPNQLYCEMMAGEWDRAEGILLCDRNGWSNRQASFWDPKECYTPLHLACSSEHVSLIPRLIAAYPDAVFRHHSWMGTPLHFAARETSEEMVLAILNGCSNSGEALVINDEYGETPIDYAFYLNLSAKVIKALLDSNRKATLARSGGFFRYNHGLLVSLLEQHGGALFDVKGMPHGLKEIYDRAELLLCAQVYGSNDSPSAGVTKNEMPLLHASITSASCPYEMFALAHKVHPEQMRMMDERGDLPIHVWAGTTSSFDVRHFFECDFCGREPATASVYFSKDPTHHYLSHHLKSENNAFLCQECHEDEEFEDFQGDEGRFAPAKPIQKEQSVLRDLLDSCPEAACLPNRKGCLPLMIAINCGKSWASGVESISQSSPRSMGTRDIQTHLYPFMLAAVKRCQIGTVLKTEQLSTVYNLLLQGPSLVQPFQLLQL